MSLAVRLFAAAMAAVAALAALRFAGDNPDAAMAWGAVAACALTLLLFEAVVAARIETALDAIGELKSKRKAVARLTRELVSASACVAAAAKAAADLQEELA